MLFKFNIAELIFFICKILPNINYYEKVCFSNGERFSIRCSNKNIFGDFKNFYDQKLSLAILPLRLFPRLKDSVDKSTIVAHPLAPKSNDEKMKLLKEIRLLS